MRDLGCIQSPQNAFILNLGLESLHVRMPRHVQNGQAVAEFLENHPAVKYVNYPVLKAISIMILLKNICQTADVE